MKDPSLLIRALYQHLKAPVGGNLAKLQPRPLPDGEIVAGAAEMAVTRTEDLPGGGWCSDGLILPRAYIGYVAVHYALNTDQHTTYPDEARILRTLSSYESLSAVASEPGFRTFGSTPSTWFINTEPTKAQKAAVLTLSFDWRLEVDLVIKEGDPP